MLHRILALARKDIRLLFTDKEALFWIFAFPLMFSLFFGYMFGGSKSGSGKIKLAVVDLDTTDGSRKFIEKLRKSDALDIQQTRDDKPLDRETAQASVRKGDYAAFLVIPKGYGKSAAEFWQQAPPLEIGIDPSRKVEEGMLEGILMEHVFSGVQEMFTDPAKTKEQARKALADLEKDQTMPEATRAALKQMVAAWDNLAGQARPQDMSRSPFAAKDRIKKVPVAEEQGATPKSAFEVTFPSAIIWGMYGCIITFAISIVQERTKGTLIRLRMSPLTQMEILAGKGLACLFVCLVVALILQLLGRFIFGVRIESVIGLALALLSVAVCFTGLMMALATVGRTERAVSGAASGIFMPLAMLGGAMVPLFFMPDWLQKLSNISPVKWSILALEGAIWRGFSLTDMLLPCGILLAIGSVFFLLGVRLLSRQEV